MYFGDALSWNLRDRHMADTLDALVGHLRRGGRAGKVVVWAHNSHLGDARATAMSRRGEINLGQLARERYGEAAVNVGLTTWGGTVTAASDWDALAERMTVRPALEGSVEALFHDVGIARFGLDLRDLGEASGALSEPMLQRAIGVVYRPRTERDSHYFHARLAQQFDFVLHLDVTRALEPIERASVATEGEPPETFPTAM
jgi:erythromycin esterase-like protein